MNIKQTEYNKKYLIGIGAALFPCMIAVGSNFQSEENGNKIPVEMPAEKPNIIFFITDDMERIMFNCLPEGKGKNLTPNIDLLVKEGVVLLGQHVSSSVCTPSQIGRAHV